MCSRWLVWAVLIVVVMCAGACSAYNPGDPEFRAVYVDGWHAGYFNTSQINQLIADALYLNANTIIVEMRRRGDAFYSSSYEPWAETVGFDALAYIIQKAHAASPRIEVQAWFVVWPIASSGSVPTNPNHPYNKYPQYLTKDESGNTVCSGNYWFDPGHPGAEQYTYNVIMDVVSRYDVDAINFDYIRFGGAHFGYNDVSVSRFNAAYGRTGQPVYGDPDWCNWRRAQVTNFVRKCYANAIAVKPNIKVTADVICGHPAPGYFYSTQAYNNYYQDWPAWMQEGILDMDMPMAYFDCSGPYAGDFDLWLCFTRNHTYNRQNAMAVGIYSASCLAEQLGKIRTLNCPGAPPCNGAAIYAYASVDTSIANAIRTVWTSPVSVPIMPWKTSPTKGHIKGNVTYGGGLWVDGATITLTGPAARSMPTDGTGFYAFIDLPPGSYNLTCSSSTYGVLTGSCTVTAGVVTSKDFDYPASSLTISNVQVGGETATGATITWTTDVFASSKVYYGTDKSCPLATTEDTALVTSHSVTLSGLSPLTRYYYKVYSKNPSVPAVLSPVYALVTAVSQPDIIVDNPSASFAGSWTLGTSSTDKYGADYKTAYLSGTNTATYTPNIPTAGNYNVYEWHPQGTNRCSSIPFTVNYNGGSYTYYVNEQVNGGKWNLLGARAFAAGTSGSVEISNQGASGGSVVIADAVRFSWALESTPPSVPTNVTATMVEDDFMTLGWTASTDNAAVAGYRVTRGGCVVDATPTNSWTDTDVIPNTRYTYAISAYDTSGNRSANSTSYTVCTLPVRPTFATVACDKPAGVWNTSGPFTFTAVGGFGAGRVWFYRYAWDTSSTYTWTGEEKAWTRDALPCAATSSANPYYLHIRGYNMDGRPGDPADLGPFYLDSTAPPAPILTDDGAYTTTRNTVHATWVANEPESSIIGYQIAVGTTSGGADLLNWTAWATDNATVAIPIQSYGSTVYVSVKAQNAAQLWGSVGTSDGIRMARPVTSTVLAKTYADTTVMRITGRTVSAVYGTCFYVQDPNMMSGLRCEGVCPYAVGTRVDVGGVLSTTSAQERALASAEVTLSP